METRQYEPTPLWEHALGEPGCPCHLLLVVQIGERLVGWCRVFPDKDASTSASIGIGVLAEYREIGLGTALVRHALEWSRNRGLKRLHLRTRVDNKRAIHMFGKFGFVRSHLPKGSWVEMEYTLAHQA